MKSHIERERTGFKVLDEILEGGFPRPASVLLIGPIGTNKNTISQQFMWQGLKLGQKAIYITVDTLPKDIIENMLKYGWDVRPYIERGQLVFVDGFSSRVGLESHARYIIENPFDIDDVLRTVFIAEQEVFGSEGHGRLVFTHLSTIMFCWNRREIMKFIERMHAEARKFNSIYMLVYSEGVRNKYIETFIKQLPDVVIALSKEWVNGRAQRYIWIEKCLKTRYPKEKMIFHTTEYGIEIEYPRARTY